MQKVVISIYFYATTVFLFKFDFIIKEEILNRLISMSREILQLADIVSPGTIFIKQLIFIIKFVFLNRLRIEFS